MNTPWRVELLGGLRAQHSDRVVTHFRTQNTGALLAYLAYYPQRAHLRDELIDLLWPDADPDAARTSLRQALFLLRQQLEPSGVSTGTVLLADRASVRLNPEAIATDVAEFDTGLQAAERAGSPAERTECLAQAVECYGGPLLPGHYDEWVLREREWLAERYFGALGELLAHLERASEFPRALEYARRGVSADPLREEGHRDLMRLLAAAGQPGAALREYQEVERLLKEELEATPAAATRALAREIERLSLLRQAPAVGPPLPGPRAAPSGEPPLTPADGENRLVTVLFTDMSRSVETTRDLHPEDAAAFINRLLQAMVDVILKYEGRIDRFQGDGALAVFGVPHAHEDDAERAIRAAMEIREAAHHLGLEVTAGINTGEVYVGAVGTERHQEVTVMGPAVSLAARLQEQAGPGQILVGETTYRQTRRAFLSTPRPMTVKGLVRPVVAYRVEEALSRPEKARGIEGLRAELIGREEELAKLKQALAEVLQGGGQMVSLIGEAGVGKSRLVAELKTVGSSRCQSPTSLWLDGRCLELGMTAGYSLFVDLFRSYDHRCRGGAPWRPDADDSRRGKRLIASLQEFVARGELTEERLEEMGPLLGNLLALRFGTDWDDRLRHASPQQIKYQTFTAVRDFFLALSRRQPLILVLEDLHWADSLSLDLISLLMETLPVAPILLLCVYRPEREHKCWHLGAIASRKCAERYTELPLRELSPLQSRRLVESLLSIENLPPSVNEAILEKSGGNPFFVEEVVRSLIDAGAIYRDGEVWRAQEEIASVMVPESIQSVILCRVDRLDGPLKQVLQSAAVIGRVFGRRLLGQVTSNETELDRALWALEELALVYQEQVIPEEEYSFQHVLTQETVYQNILRRHRAAFHQRVAEAVEALYGEHLEPYYEQLAYHYERGGSDGKAVEYLLKAGEKSRRAYLREEALGYFQRALERLEGSPLGEARKDWRLEALKGLGWLTVRMGKLAEGEERLRQAFVLGQQMELAPRELVRLYYWLADAMFWRMQYDEMLRLGEEGLARLGEDTESVEAALMNRLVAAAHRLKGDMDKARPFAYRNAQFLQRLPYSEELTAAYSDLMNQYFYYDKNVEEAAKWLQAAEQKAEEHHALWGAGIAHQNASYGLAARGDFRGALARDQRAIELFTRIGDNVDRQFCLRSLAKTFLALGDLQRAEEALARGSDIAERTGYKPAIAEFWVGRGTVALCRGALEQAADAFQRAKHLYLEISPGRGWLWAPVTLALVALGRAYLALRKPHQAAEQFQAAMALAGTDAVSLFTVNSFVTSAQVLAAAVSGLEEAYEDPEAFRASCLRFREEHPALGDAHFLQWFLEPTEPLPFAQPQIEEAFVASLASDWVWNDPFGDSSCTVQNGLEIQAANGRDLWHINLGAPRLLRSVSGEFAVQTVRIPGSAEKPAVGGILLWKDPENFLRLDKGTGGDDEIAFMGCLRNKDVIVGRGHLPGERVFLRLERVSGRVNALCSSNGTEWFTVGHVEFPQEDPMEIGLHAVGNINRLWYPGAYPEGSAIRFETFDVWGRDL